MNPNLKQRAVGYPQQPCCSCTIGCILPGRVFRYFFFLKVHVRGISTFCDCPHHPSLELSSSLKLSSSSSTLCTSHLPSHILSLRFENCVTPPNEESYRICPSRRAYSHPHHAVFPFQGCHHMYIPQFVFYFYFLIILIFREDLSTKL